MRDIMKRALQKKKHKQKQTFKLLTTSVNSLQQSLHCCVLGACFFFFYFDCLNLLDNHYCSHENSSAVRNGRNDKRQRYVLTQQVIWTRAHTPRSLNCATMSRWFKSGRAQNRASANIFVTIFLSWRQNLCPNICLRDLAKKSAWIPCYINNILHKSSWEK